MPLALPSRLRHPPLRAALPLAAALAFVLLTGWIDGGQGVLPLRLLDQPRFPFANALPGLLLAGLLLTLTRRLGFAFGVTLLLQGLIYAINTLKLANLGMPLLPADFRMVGQLRRGGFHLLAGYLPHSPWPYLTALAGLAVLVAAWRLEPPLLPRRTGGKRLAAGAALALLLGSLLGGWSGWGKLYNARVLWLEPWSAASTRAHSGLVSELVMFRLQYAQNKPRPDRAEAARLLARYAPALRQAMPPTTVGNPPDIVVVQSESFFDPARLRGITPGAFTPNFSRLAAQGESGALYVPTFGGGTIRTEFEVLTGLSLRYFANLQFPYLQMNHKAVPSLVQALDASGYVTTALHGNDPGFWNRTTAFKALGFRHFVSQAAFPAEAPRDGKYMADRAMTDAIVGQLKDSGPPQFIFAISIEAHGPYDVAPADTAARDAIAVPAGLDAKARLELQNYLYHLRHADQELGRLADLLSQRQRPTLLLFYGDHLPALGDAFRELGFVDGGDMLAQSGSWLLLDPRGHAAATHADTAAWLLPGRLLAAAGLPDDGYFALTRRVGAELATLTRTPGAAPAAQAAALHQLDHAMASIEQLRMTGKLDALLKQALALPPTAAKPRPETPGTKSPHAGLNP